MMFDACLFQCIAAPIVSKELFHYSGKRALPVGLNTIINHSSGS